MPRSTPSPACWWRRRPRRGRRTFRCCLVPWKGSSSTLGDVQVRASQGRRGRNTGSNATETPRGACLGAAKRQEIFLSGPVVAEFVESVIVDTEVMRDLVYDSDPDFLDDLLVRVAYRQNRMAKIRIRSGKLVYSGRVR